MMKKKWVKRLEAGKVRIRKKKRSKKWKEKWIYKKRAGNMKIGKSK